MNLAGSRAFRLAFELPKSHATGPRRQDCLGRFPLIFCLQLIRPSDQRPGLGATRLFFVEAPPPVSGGPVPQHFQTATQRLQMGRCVVLHAALGGAPPGLALRSALGPLQRLAEKEGQQKGGGLWDLRCLSRSLVIQAEKAAQAQPAIAFRVISRGEVA